jgi:prevent-host-death family protein
VKIVNMHEARTKLSALLAQVEQGEEVVVARNGVWVARLVREAPQHGREPGSWRNLPGWETFRYDRGLFAPMAEAELADEGWP